MFPHRGDLSCDWFAPVDIGEIAGLLVSLVDEFGEGVRASTDHSIHQTWIT